MDYNQAKEALLEICKWGGSGDEKEVKKILDTHPSLLNESLNSAGYSVLLLASDWDHINIIKLLLSSDSLDINKQDNSGVTALCKACLKGLPEVVELLLSHNIDVNLQDNGGDTALHAAFLVGSRPEIKEMLLSHKNIDVNIRNNEGFLACDPGSSLMYLDDEDYY